MRYHALVQLQKTETCPNNQAMEFGCWLFFRRSAVRVGLKRVGAVVRATARPGHPDAIPPNRSAARGAAGAGRWAEMVNRSISNTPILMVSPNSYRHKSYLENRGSAKRRAAVRVVARPGSISVTSNQMTYSRFSKTANPRIENVEPAMEPLNNNAPNWSWAIKLIAGRSIQPIGCFDNQYGIFNRLNIDALTKVAERHILKMVLGQYVARSSRKLSQSSAKVSAGNKIKNSELSPLTADNHSQIPKALSMVDSLLSVCVRTWQSTPFNAASTANGACHGNSLARESATIYRGTRVFL